MKLFMDDLGMYTVVTNLISFPSHPLIFNLIFFSLLSFLPSSLSLLFTLPSNSKCDCLREPKFKMILSSVMHKYDESLRMLNNVILIGGFAPKKHFYLEKRWSLQMFIEQYRANSINRAPEIQTESEQ